MDIKDIMGNFEGFLIQDVECGSRESMAVSIFASLNRIPYRIYRAARDIKVPINYIPVGSIEWCLGILGREVVPDYYPDFLRGHLHRKVYETNEWPLGERVFIKPADKYKRFNGFVTNGGYKGKKRGPYWCSEVVSFVNEWRYYVSFGEVLGSGWYMGDEVNTPEAPKLEIEIPDYYCGAIDFGLLGSGEVAKMALVEANHPFACGWYGKEHEIYARWLVNGWRYMLG